MAKNLRVLYGKRSILERLKTHPSSIRKIFVEKDFKDAQIFALLKEHRIRFEETASWKMRSMKSARNVQGIAAKVEQFDYLPYQKLLTMHQEKGYSLVFLDGINDPHNLGVIMRTLACFGGFGIVLPAHGACGINDTVMHVALGGENYVPASTVESIPQAISEAKNKGITIIGSVVHSEENSIFDLDIPSPAGVVFGAEHEGIHPDILPLLDEKVYIPNPGADLSLNITVACAIVCAEIMRRSGRKAIL